MNKTYLRKLMARKRFQAYLDHQPYNESAGICGDAKKCAIGKYLLRSTEPKQIVSVGIRTISVFNTTVKNETISIPTPLWAKSFIRKFDNKSDIPDKTKTFFTAANILGDLPNARL